MTRVAVVHNLRFGGAYRRMSEQFARLGVDAVEVTLQGAEPLTPDAIIVPLRYRDGSVPAALRPLSRYLDLVALVGAYRRLHDVLRAQRPDVIWLNSCRYLQAPFLSPDLAARTVYHCDEPRRVDYEPEAHQSTRLRTRLPYWPMRRAQRALDRKTARSVRVLTTNSDYGARQVDRAYGRSARVLPCGVSPDFRPSEDPIVRSGLLSVGSLIPSKGHDLAIEAIGLSHRPHRLTVVAPRPDHREEERLQRLARQCDVDLTIRTGVSDDDLIHLYQSALATLYLARAEPFGLVSIEAQSCGGPVIVSDEGGLPETVVHGSTGWVVARDANSVAGRIRDLDDETARSRMGHRAALGASRWSWERSAGDLRQALAAVAAQ